MIQRFFSYTIYTRCLLSQCTFHFRKFPPNHPNRGLCELT